MTITKQTVAEKLAAYLHHEMTLAQLVDWAESALMEGEFAEAERDAVKNVLSHLGVADVHAFGLTWEDCEELLRHVGVVARVELIPA